GKGKRQGRINARTPKKEKWMMNVRAQRKFLQQLRKDQPGLFEKTSYADVYKKIKGGFFKGKKYIEAYVKGAS
ncbi:MAG: 50S ribosomal protein L19e, partial [Candidatus Diapherotrites archaeon]|nr:50S ribosomal protein L19e [Candidatus Diapherotrites archaeon]